jgi:YHS domain-containing protein
MFSGKKIISIFVTCLFLFSVSVFAVDDAINTGRFNNTAIDGYDTVAYFTQKKPVEGNKAHQVKWRDANWYFSNKDNKALFIAHPEKYAPQYGGWCAYAMSDEGRTIRTDPDAFVIYNGKLYLNYSKSVQRVWLENKLANIKEADHFYPLETNVKTFN